jgi:hypothetical protein
MTTPATINGSSTAGTSMTIPIAEAVPMGDRPVNFAVTPARV